MIYYQCSLRIKNANSIKQVRPNFLGYSNYGTNCGLLVSRLKVSLWRKKYEYIIHLNGNKLDLLDNEKEALFNQILEKKEELNKA